MNKDTFIKLLMEDKIRLSNRCDSIAEFLDENKYECTTNVRELIAHYKIVNESVSNLVDVILSSFDVVDSDEDSDDDVSTDPYESMRHALGLIDINKLPDGSVEIS